MDFTNAKLPPIYKRNGRDCYLDPIRKRLIYITPEETVRQQVIWYLLNELKVPENMIAVEDRIAHYGIKSRNRADIVILAQDSDGVQFPLAVIECKSETVALDDKAFEQMIGYCDDIRGSYMMLINGIWQYCYKYEAEKDIYVEIDDLPQYSEMLAGDFTAAPPEVEPEDYTYEELDPTLRDAFKEAIENDSVGDISPYTPFELALPVFNLWYCLLNMKSTLPAADYGLFRLLEDYGVRYLSYGNRSGGHFEGPYRSFLVDVNGNTEFFSISVASYYKSSWDLNEKHPLTSICVAHDTDTRGHHSLQLLVDEDCVTSGRTVHAYHNGRIAIGRIGSGKKAELRDLVSKRYPKILKGECYYLGSFTADHLLQLDEPDVTDLIVNLISYAIVRDEYREIVKARFDGK